jgi:hypothetical protein
MSFSIFLGEKQYRDILDKLGDIKQYAGSGDALKVNELCADIHDIMVFDCSCLNSDEIPPPTPEPSNELEMLKKK